MANPSVQKRKKEEWPEKEKRETEKMRERKKKNTKQEVRKKSEVHDIRKEKERIFGTQLPKLCFGIAKYHPDFIITLQLVLFNHPASITNNGETILVAVSIQPSL